MGTLRLVDLVGGVACLYDVTSSATVSVDCLPSTVSLLHDLVVHPGTDEPMFLAEVASQLVLNRWDGLGWVPDVLPVALDPAEMTVAPGGMVEIVGRDDTDLYVLTGEHGGAWSADLVGYLSSGVTMDVVHATGFGPIAIVPDGDGVWLYESE